MTRTKIIFLSTIVLVLSAGVVLGRLSAWFAPLAVTAPLTVPPPPHIGGPGGPVGFGGPPFIPAARFAELNLTPDQKTQIDAIWADLRQQMHKFDDQHNSLRQERTDAVNKILTPDQRTACEHIDSDFRAKDQALFQAREKLIHDANEKTVALLNESQRKTWDTMTHGGPRERRGGRGGPTTQRSTTRPAAGAGGETRNGGI